MKLITSLLAFLILITTSAQNQHDTTKLTIIGTIHIGNKHLNHKTLFEVLKDINPDVILSEQSSEYKRVFGLLTANFLEIWNPDIEQLALQKYTRWNKNCKVLPFDIIIRNRKKYRSEMNINDAKVFEALKTKLSANIIKGNDSIEFAKYSRVRDQYYNKIFDTTLERINRKDMIELTRMRFNLDKNLIQHLANKYITDTSLVNWFIVDINFWDKRNTYMVNQILNYIELYKGKKIVVLTGLHHKYYLLDKINESNNDAIEIIEFVKYQN